MKSKVCSGCKTVAKTGAKFDNVSHDCAKNWEESSKAMEAALVLELAMQVHRKGQQLNMPCFVSHLVADDNSTMRSVVTHSSRLPLHVPEPKFLCDPTHRRKVVGKHLFALKGKGKKQTDCSQGDCLCLQRCWGHVIKQNRHKPFEEFQKAAKQTLVPALAPGSPGGSRRQQHR